MKKRYSEEQIVRILQEADGEGKVAEGTFYRWKMKFGGMEVPDVKRLKVLEAENRKLKQIVAE
jgi:putative transposase